MPIVRIALGLGVHLDAFAEVHGAETYREWGDDAWQRRLFSIASDEATEIYWNLTDVEVGPGLTRAAARVGGATDSELLLMRENPDWLPRCRWFRDGDEVAAPGELATAEFTDE